MIENSSINHSRKSSILNPQYSIINYVVKRPFSLLFFFLFYALLTQIVHAQVTTSLSLDLSSSSIFQNDTIDVTGILTEIPDKGSNLSGLTITIGITDPDGISTAQTTITDTGGSYVYNALSGFTESGFYSVQASFGGTGSFAASSSAIEGLLVASCARSIFPTSESFGLSGGAGSLVITDDSGCGWTAQSNDSWISITSGSSGNGGGTVSYYVSTNAFTFSRTGTITVAGNTFTVTQTGGGVCTYYLLSTSGSSSSSADTGSVSVIADSYCEWTAKSNIYWIKITSGSEGAGNGTVAYSVDENTGATSRTGTIIIVGDIEGETFTVTQDGTCEGPASIFPISKTFDDYSAMTDSVDVSDPDSCGWTAVSNDHDWITIDSGSSGIGDGEVTYSIFENTKTTSRTGSINIAGKTFEITQNGKEDEVDDIAPSVTIDSPKDGITTEMVYFIYGRSSDDSPSSGIDRVEIQVSDGSGNYLGPDGNWRTTEQWTTVSGTESWFYDASSVDWEDGTRYTLTAKVFDKEGNNRASGIFFTYKEDRVQFYSILSLGLSSHAILQNETTDASGKLTRLPDNGTDLSGETVNLTITPPIGDSITYTTTTYDFYGHYEFEGISGFTQKGSYKVQVSFDGTSTLVASSSDALSVLVGSSAGYAIIIEGKVSSEEGLDSHNKTANRIYDTLIKRGFVDENIYYFNYDTSQTGVDAYPTVADIQNVIVSWPLEKMNGSSAPLYIVLHDHGNKKTFYLDDETITPNALDSWLDMLESGLNSNALLEKRIIMYGACYSGSFISALSKPATDTDGGRVVITSAATDEESYKGPMEPDGIRSGSYFLEEFFGELERGYSIKDSFKSATEKTETFTRKGGGTANTYNAYFDNSMQHPLLDDGGDGVGSNVLSEGADDGQIAKDLYLGVGVNYDINSANNPAEVVYVTDTVHLGPFTSSYLMWATANDNNEVSSVWMEIRAPSKTLSGTGESNSNQLSTDYKKELMTLETTDNWEKQIDTFTESGMYEIFYFARDTTTFEISPMKRLLVYKDKVGNNPPSIFNLMSPEYASDEMTILLFKWEATSDPDGDNITYNLLVATDEEFNNVVYKKEEITTTAAIVDVGAGLSDLTTYYWKVQAIDSYGLMTDSKQTWPFYTNNTNFGFGFITGIVYDARSFAPIVGADVKTDFGDEDATKTEGYYIMSANEGAYTVTCSFNGYPDTSFSGISVSNGKTTELNIPMTSSVTSTSPTPDIKANGSSNTVTIGTGDTLSITVSLSAGDSSGVKCDWWAAESAPDGWYYYSLSTFWTYAGSSYTDLLPTYQGALSDLNTYEVLNMSGLSEGTHTFYFAIDKNMDGILNFDPIYFDSVIVNVQ